MSSRSPVEKDVSHEAVQTHSLVNEKSSTDEKNLQQLPSNSNLNLVYDHDDEEPEIHARTWIALVAMFFLNFVQVLALQGPPSTLSFIGADLHNTARQTWVPNALSLVQAVLTPVLSSASDLFQARKFFLVVPSIVSFVGSAIAPGSTSIYRLIVAQILIGFGFSTVALAYCVPSEILPRKWRPAVQAVMNVAAALGASVGPLIIGSLTKKNQHTGWRNFYWIQMALWGLSAIGLFVGYTPPKRHTRYDKLSVWQKLGKLDLIGFGLLTTGLTLFLTGLNLGGGIFKWTASQVLAPLVVGIAILLTFGIFEWKGTSTGIAHHELFRGGKDRGRTFSICLGLIFIEGVMLFSYIIFYPVLTTSLYETDPFLNTAREQPFWVAAGLSTLIYGYASTKRRSIRVPIFVGFLIFTAGIVGLATLNPSDSTRALVFAGLAGLGFGAPLVLITAGVQLSTPAHLIATATALVTSTRSIASTVFTAIYSASFTTRVDDKLPKYVAQAAIKAGLPLKSVPAFVGALAGNNATALAKVPGVTPVIIGSGVHALKQALADSLRVVYIIAAPFGILACIACFLLGDLRKTMTYRVDAPLEDLTAKHRHESSA